MPPRFGVCLPDNGPLARPQAITSIARHAEQIGLDILALSDHVVIPRAMRESTYPYAEDGEWPGGDDCLEMLSAVSFVAACTTTARLLTSVMVLPYRPPVLTAKMLATIDVLSNGRLLLGCGVGWLAEEFAAIGSPRFAERGAASDEYLEVFKELWTEDDPQFEGKYARFHDISFLPRPVHKPHPPIWIGGESAPAMRRTARLGDVWYPISDNPRSPLATFEQMRDAIGRLRREAERVGRDPDEIGIALSAAGYDHHAARQGGDGERLAFTGRPAQIAADIERFAGLGIESFILPVRGESVDQWRLELDLLANGVLSLLGA